MKTQVEELVQMANHQWEVEHSTPPKDSWGLSKFAPGLNRRPVEIPGGARWYFERWPYVRLIVRAFDDTPRDRATLLIDCAHRPLRQIQEELERQLQERAGDIPPTVELGHE